MIYNKKTWRNGETIYASALNHMEEGIARMNNVQSSSLMIAGAQIDDMNVITQLYNSHSIAFYNCEEYKHRPFEYGLIITHDSPFSAFLGGPQYDQIGFSLSSENAGKFYKRIVLPDFDKSLDDEPYYNPTENDWEEASYTKEELDAIFKGVMSFLGNVEAPPETANHGDICKITKPLAISTGKFKIPVSGIISITETNGSMLDPEPTTDIKFEENTSSNPIIYFLQKVYESGNGYLPSGSTFAPYIKKNGEAYYLNFAYQTDVYTVNGDVATISKYFENGTDLICWFEGMTDTSDVPDLEPYLMYKTYPAGTYFIRNGNEWLVLSEPYAMTYKGEVSSLPDIAWPGDVYRLTSKSMPTGKLSLEVSGVISITDSEVYAGCVIDLEDNSALHEFFKYAYKGLQAYDGVAFGSYCQKAGEATLSLNVSSMSANDYALFDTTAEELKKYFTNGNVLTLWCDDMSGLPEALSKYYLKYPAGTCFVYKNDKWQSLNSHVVAELNSRVKFLEDNTKKTALKDLSNVTNKAFKEKAEKAGIGGTSGAMVFKGVVNALPSSANEGEVYSAKGTAPKWENLLDNSTASCNIIVSKYNGVEAETRNGGTSGTIRAIANVPTDYWYGSQPFKLRFIGNNKTSIVEVTNFEYGDVPDGTSYLYANGTASEDIAFNIGDAISVDYATEEVSVSGTYVYHNGEWVEL